MLNNYFLLFAGLGLFGYSIYLFMSSILYVDKDLKAMNWLEGDSEEEINAHPILKFSKPLVHNLTLSHAVKVKSPAYREKVKKNIYSSGLGSILAVEEYIGLQILWGLFFPLFLAVFNFALQLDLPYFVILLIGVGGFTLPKLYCENLKQRRYVSIIKELPFFIDLLALSTEAGLDFTGSIQRITDTMEDDNVFNQELKIFLKDIKLGSSREEALQALAKKLDIPEVTSFCSVIIDAMQTGVSVAKVLKDQSEQMRGDRLARAEKAGARASQTILFPMVLFIVPSIFIIVFSPMILQFFYAQ